MAYVQPDAARAAFRRALAIAESEEPVPGDWVDRTMRIGDAPNQTFVAMLGTALLARAARADIEPTALKSNPEVPPESGLEPYSARGLAMNVLVPEAVRAGVHLGVTGREPLNNQPFFGKDKVHGDLPVTADTQPHLDGLVAALDAARTLAVDEAVLALAAFLRVRLDVKRDKEARLELGEGRLPFRELAGIVAQFVAEDPEGGRRGQAFVAAALDMVYPEVVTSRINDPSRHGPGDVRAFRDEVAVVAAEVKQKPATDTDMLLFAADLAERGPTAGIYAALASDQPDLDTHEIADIALEEHGVVLEVFHATISLLRAAFVWSSVDAEDFLNRFPEAMHRRLIEMEVSGEALDAWARTFML